MCTYLLVHPTRLSLHDSFFQLFRHPVAVANTEANVRLCTDFVHILATSALAPAESCLYVVCKKFMLDRDEQRQFEVSTGIHTLTQRCHRRDLPFVICFTK